MSHQHFCDVAGHWWECEGTALRPGDKEPSVCMCLKCGVPLEFGDHSHDFAELLACPEHRKVAEAITAPHPQPVRDRDVVLDLSLLKTQFAPNSRQLLGLNIAGNLSVYLLVVGGLVSHRIARVYDIQASVDSGACTVHLMYATRTPGPEPPGCARRGADFRCRV